MTAFRATFSDMKLVKTRQVAQLIFEIPLSEFDAAYEVLGGMPNPANERWFGIAAIKVSEATETSRPGQESTLDPDRAKPTKRDWCDVQPAAQAGIRCAEPAFRAFLREVKQCEIRDNDPESMAWAVRRLCGVTSRVELGTRHAARVLWNQLDDEYQAWLAKERVGA
jgi:hypothetical protein